MKKIVIETCSIHRNHFSVITFYSMKIARIVPATTLYINFDNYIYERTPVKDNGSAL